MMKKMFVSGLTILFALLITINLSFAEAAPQNVIDLANSKLAAIGTDAVLVDAVKAENAKGKSMADIEAMDTKWKGDAGVADYMKAMMDSAAGKRHRPRAAAPGGRAARRGSDRRGTGRTPVARYRGAGAAGRSGGRPAANGRVENRRSSER